MSISTDKWDAKAFQKSQAQENYIVRQSKLDRELGGSAWMNKNNDFNHLNHDERGHISTAAWFGIIAITGGVGLLLIAVMGAIR